MDKTTKTKVGVSADRSPGDFIKEMLIAFIGGGCLGLVILVVTVAIIQHYK
jgi:hypothetical protein